MSIKIEGIDGREDMKLIYGTIVAKKKDKPERDDKVSQKNTKNLLVFPGIGCIFLVFILVLKLTFLFIFYGILSIVVFI